MILKEIQRFKRSMLSKLSRDPSVQELPREVHIVKSRVLSRSCTSCKRPTVGADEPSVVKKQVLYKHVIKELVIPTLLSIS